MCDFTALASHLRQYALRQACCIEDAEDAAESAITRMLIKESDDFRLGEKIVRDELVNIRRQRAKTVCIGLTGDRLPIGLLLTSLCHVRADYHDQIRRMIAETNVTERQRQCLLMRLDGWTETEIAAKLRISQPCVSKHVGAGVRRLLEYNPAFEMLFYWIARVTIKGGQVRSAKLLAQDRLWERYW